MATEGEASVAGFAVRVRTFNDLPEEILRRYRNPDGKIGVSLEEIVRIEERCRTECFDPSTQNGKHWDGPPVYKNLPF